MTCYSTSILVLLFQSLYSMTFFRCLLLALTTFIIKDYFIEVNTHQFYSSLYYLSISSTDFQQGLNLNLTKNQIFFNHKFKQQGFVLVNNPEV